MAISWNEIKDRALNFSNEWSGETKERAEKDSFWNDFFEVFGMTRRRVASFEEPVKKLSGNQGFIDLFWKGMLLVEHKSKGKDLEKALTQAQDYFPGIKEHELPKYILVSDFERFKLYDLDEGIENEFHINQFHENVKLFGFVAGYQKRIYKEEEPVNIKAAYLMGKIHDQIEEIGYQGHNLEVFLVRLLFCLFADDTGIFNKDSLNFLIDEKTKEDGSDLGAMLAQLFQVLNTPEESRLKNLDEDLDQFPYVNGKLFEEVLPITSFNTNMRTLILEACSLDWGKISPAIFGSMFQSVMNSEERRNLGAHYTSEKNILKLIKPLFLDELYAEFKKVKSNKKQLLEFHQKLSTLKFLDPACGCGNFLIISYREIRLLEIEVIKVLLYKHQKLRKEVLRDALINISHFTKINVDQFYGIDIDEFACKIGEVAMWLMDHQMNLRISEEFGQYFARLPLKKSATIVHGNALKIKWTDIVSKNDLSYIIGNPPFIGHHYQSKDQKKELNETLDGVKASGVMDFVAAWYYLAAKYITKTSIKVAFVSTNSIAQGEQVGILWKPLIENFNIKIHFAHRTFNWSNEAKGKAAVHVVIIGFACLDTKNKRLFIYEDINEDPSEIKAKNINPYLVDAKDTVVLNRSLPLCDVPKMKYGSKPTDGGHLILTTEERNELIRKKPANSKVIKPFLSAKEFLNNGERWCIWLVDVSPSELKKLPDIITRVKMVKQFRAKSIAKSTREYPYHTLFRQVTQPKSDFILVPRVSSERRKYIPFGFFSKENIVSDSCQAIPNGSIYDFGILTSEMHMSWVKYTCGRLKSDYRYSKDIVYNNFPWPEESRDKNKKVVETKAQKVLDVRAEFAESSLADLYDPLIMPPKLVKAHKELDKAVDLCYRRQAFTNETIRIAYLFQLYNEYIETSCS